MLIYPFYDDINKFKLDDVASNKGNLRFFWSPEHEYFGFN
jgi:hypothetical protein